MNYRIGISGSYGGMNLGDEAILQGILSKIRTSSMDTEIIVFSYNPEDTQKRHNVKALPVREMHKDQVMAELKNLDLFILGGGGLLFNDRVEIFLRDVIWAQELNIPVMVYAISVGPLKKPESKQLIADVLNKVDVITVRENESKRILHDLGVTKSIEVTADPAFLIESRPFTEDMLNKEGITPDVPLVGISVREPGPAAPDLDPEHYLAIFANAADFMIDRFEAQVIFVPIESERDSPRAHAVISKMLNTKKALVLKREYTSPEILGLVEHMEFCVGMRLHFLIFSAIKRIPFVPLPYATKVKGLLEELEMSFPPIEQWNTGRLCAVLDRAWDTRETHRAILEKKVPQIQKKAEKTHLILCDLLYSVKDTKVI